MPEPILCPNWETCEEIHNPVSEEDGTEHHYGCECDACMYYYWMLKR